MYQYGEKYLIHYLLAYFLLLLHFFSVSFSSEGWRLMDARNHDRGVAFFRHEWEERGVLRQERNVLFRESLA
jgi:hypothetical protein